MEFFMARNIVIMSDLSGDGGAIPVTFAFHGRAYEIDLTDDEFAAFEEALKPYIGKARHVGRKTATAGDKTVLPADPKAIRAWADAHGFMVPKKGRVPKHIVEKYEAAH
jgi:hypothetical protein